jgi:hypothetical protein
VIHKQVVALSIYAVVASISCSFRIALELAPCYMPPGPPGPSRLRVKTAAESRPGPAARARPVSASAREAQTATPDRRRQSGVADWEVALPARCSTRRTGGSPVPRPLFSRLIVRRHAASERLQHRPFQPVQWGGKACRNRGFHEWRFPIHAWQKSHSE